MTREFFGNPANPFGPGNKVVVWNIGAGYVYHPSGKSYQPSIQGLPKEVREKIAGVGETLSILCRGAGLRVTTAPLDKEETSATNKLSARANALAVTDPRYLLLDAATESVIAGMTKEEIQVVHAAVLAHAASTGGVLSWYPPADRAIEYYLNTRCCMYGVVGTVPGEKGPENAKRLLITMPIYRETKVDGGKITVKSVQAIVLYVYPDRVGAGGIVKPVAKVVSTVPEIALPSMPNAVRRGPVDTGALLHTAFPSLSYTYSTSDEAAIEVCAFDVCYLPADINKADVVVSRVTMETKAYAPRTEENVLQCTYTVGGKVVYTGNDDGATYRDMVNTFRWKIPGLWLDAKTGAVSLLREGGATIHPALPWLSCSTRTVLKNTVDQRYDYHFSTVGGSAMPVSGQMAVRALGFSVASESSIQVAGKKIASPTTLVWSGSRVLEGEINSSVGNLVPPYWVYRQAPSGDTSIDLGVFSDMLLQGEIKYPFPPQADSGNATTLLQSLANEDEDYDFEPTPTTNGYDLLRVNRSMDQKQSPVDTNGDIVFNVEGGRLGISEQRGYDFVWQRMMVWRYGASRISAPAWVTCYERDVFTSAQGADYHGVRQYPMLTTYMDIGRIDAGALALVVRGDNAFTYIRLRDDSRVLVKCVPSKARASGLPVRTLAAVASTRPSWSGPVRYKALRPLRPWFGTSTPLLDTTAKTEIRVRPVYSGEAELAAVRLLAKYLGVGTTEYSGEKESADEKALLTAASKSFICYDVLGSDDGPYTATEVTDLAPYIHIFALAAIGEIPGTVFTV